jgi:dTMP kinase
MSGRFITFEGIDGAGKSTHISWFAQQLASRGHELVITREPGGTALGEKLRDLLLSDPMSIESETLLMFAARMEHLDKLILPAIRRGAWVICDRFTDSTYAYQGGGRALPLSRIATLEHWVQQGLQPDRTYLFDLPADLAAARRAQARAADRFEAEDLEFFDKVRCAYLHRVEQDPARFMVIDSQQGIEEIQAILKKDIASL